MNFNPQALPDNFPLKIQHFSSLDSTNLFLKNAISGGQLHDDVFCVADTQTNGYGQHGRQWNSSIDFETLTCSFAFSFDYPIERLLLKSVPLALIIFRLLNRYSNSHYQVKWPNDIYSEKAKAAGCLLEVVKSPSKQSFVIFGLGVNLTSPGVENYGYVENLEVYPFIYELALQLKSFFKNDFFPGFDELLEEWQSNDYFKIGEPVNLYIKDDVKKGIYQGLNHLFQPQILVDGELKTYSTGQISIRKI